MITEMYTQVKDQILNHIAEFYTKLYTEEPTDRHVQQTLLDSIHRRLPTDVSETLEGELDLNECYKLSPKCHHSNLQEQTGFLLNSIPCSGTRSDVNLWTKLILVIDKTS